MPARDQCCVPEPRSCIDLIHGSPDTRVWLNVSHQGLNNHEPKCAHALGQLILDLICNLLFSLQEDHGAAADLQERGVLLDDCNA